MADSFQVAQHFLHQRDTMQSLIAKHEAMGTKLKQTGVALGQQQQQAGLELAAIYLPALTDDAFARAAQLTGFQGFARRDPRLAMQQEKKVLQSSLAQLDADERYQRRDVLVGPAGTLQQELEAAQESLAPLQAECERFETLQDFLELVQIGYDTPNFKEHWWNAAYWKHWAAGDRICKALALNDFGDDVLPAYRKYQEPRDVLAADVARIAGQIKAVHDVTQQRDQTADRLAHLDEIYLESAQGFLAEHLAHADHALLEQWVADQPEQRAVQQALRKVAGLAAKQQIVGEIAGQGVPQMITSLSDRYIKAQQKATKYMRPKYQGSTVPDELINQDFDRKTQALADNQAKLERRLDAMMRFDDYSRFNLANDSQLWWWYFFESAPNRYYTPSLFDYYQRQPNIHIVEDDLGLDAPGERAAAAFIAGNDLEQAGGYLS